MVDTQTGKAGEGDVKVDMDHCKSMASHNVTYTSKCEISED